MNKLKNTYYYFYYFIIIFYLNNLILKKLQMNNLTEFELGRFNLLNLIIKLTFHQKL